MKKFISLVKRLRLGPAAVLGVAVAVAVGLIATRPERAPLTLPERAWSVNVLEARPATIAPTLSLYGRVESPRDAGLTAAIEADVLDVPVRDGDRVEAGDPLVLLDDQEAALELMQREADVQEIQAQIALERQRLVRNREALDKEVELLELVEANAERVRSLYVDKLLSQANVDESAEEFKRQQLAVTSRRLAIEESEIRIRQLDAQRRRAAALRDRAQLTVDRTRVTAPFAGLVADVQVSPGDRVRVGDGLLRLYDPSVVEVRTQVPTRYADRVRQALAAGEPMPAEVQLAGSGLDARLVRVSGQTREGAGSVDAFLRFADAPRSPQVGATVPLKLSLPAEPGVVAVPAEAVYGRNRLYVVEAGRMAAVDVERVGERSLADGRTQVIVRSPELVSGEQIITTKVSTAAEGLLVDIRPSNGEDSSMLASSDEQEPST